MKGKIIISHELYAFSGKSLIESRRFASLMADDWLKHKSSLSSQGHGIGLQLFDVGKDGGQRFAFSSKLEFSFF